MNTGRTEARRLVASSRTGILLDTNILLLLLVGKVEKELVGNCSRLKAYSIDDFLLLEWLLMGDPGFAITPHIATETWNLGENALAGDHQTRFKSLFISYLENAREAWVPVKLLAGESYFPRLGVADSGAARIKRRRPVVITDDAKFTVQLETQRSPVVNFTWLRDWG